MPVKTEKTPADKPASQKTVPVVEFKPQAGKPAPKPTAEAKPNETPKPARTPGQPQNTVSRMYRNLDVSKIKFTSDDAPPEDLEKEVPEDEELEGAAEGGDDEDDGEETPAVSKPKSLAQALKPKSDAKPEPLSKSFLELTRQKQKLDEREKALADREKKISEGGSTVDALEKEFRADPLGFIKKRGIDYEQLTEMVVSGKKPAGTDPEVLTLKKQLEDMAATNKKRDADLAEREAQAQLAQFRADLTEHITEQGEKYELINTLGRYGDVIDVIKEYARETGEVADFDLAAEYVEAQLEEEKEQERLKLLKTKKFRGKLGASSKSEDTTRQPSGERPPAIQARKGPRTLTNDSTEAGADEVSKPLTREQRLRKAASVIRFTES